MLKVNIKGLEWSCRKLRHKDYRNKHGSSSLAVCVKGERKLDFDASEFRYSTVLHEVVHAFMGSLCLHSTSDISMEDMEEIFAELIENHVEDIIETAKFIYKELK